ncbi:MAG: acetyl-coenzyme A carboxylase carboxyl transferase subunit beta [Rhodothalassiaceae bacterium]|nr:MAG: acetyl-coenzyme A carboxylase carboxyl transferase subunit beta [Rhodothalassiaceae bacterium]
MNWLREYVKPRIQRAIRRKREAPDNLWHKCDGCGQLIFHKEFAAHLHVCPHCGHHARIAPAERFRMLFDEGRYETVPLPEVAEDPLRFKDTKRYADRLKQARQKTGARDAMEVAVGPIGGIETVVAAQNFFFMGGSMGLAVGEAMIRAAEEAVARRTGLVAVTAAGGARMQEGILSLMQMPRTTIAVQMVKEAGLPYIVVLTDPTTGGVTASFAMLGDVHIAEPGALIGFAGPRVIEQTIREKLPEGFQRAEYLRDHGMVDMVVPRAELKATLARLLAHMLNRPEPALAEPPAL